jgi:hypothetical protein
VTKAPTPEKASPEKKKPAGPRTPYPVEHIGEQPGSEPDYIPPTRPETLPKM